MITESIITWLIIGLTWIMFLGALLLHFIVNKIIALHQRILNLELKIIRVEQNYYQLPRKQKINDRTWQKN